jgi:glycosyltransferase involved in cell wall biosynthesis
MAYEAAGLWLYLLVRRRPDLAIVSQGGNHDGWPLAAICRGRGIPYVCLCHKASDLHWPADRWREPIRAAFAAARRSFFVADHTLRLTEEQIGGAVANASLVCNPFNVAWDRPQPWPSTQNGFRLGCVGRLDLDEKGQDIVLRVLALKKWRERPVSVTFLGAGEQRQGLEAMGAWLGLSSIRFAGLSDDIEAFWRNHHALVLPSRAEGLPLVIVEALLSGRIAIVTDVGGNAELLEEGATAFIAEAATEKALDDAMERAWTRRDEWAALGAAAAVSARGIVPTDPARDFADRLLEIACGRAVRQVKGPAAPPGRSRQAPWPRTPLAEHGPPLLPGLDRAPLESDAGF